jgi:hypothetical protein
MPASRVDMRRLEGCILDKVDKGIGRAEIGEMPAYIGFQSRRCAWQTVGQVASETVEQVVNERDE